ncbi:MAG: hypothetical protein HYZ14_02455 [Bacteroidetes bacterium]|nr:hypothetical protein [Bacteroidota bacterium]
MKHFSWIITVLIPILVGMGCAGTAHAQCDATFVPSHQYPVTGTPVHFLYWGDITYDPSVSYTIDYGNGTSSGPNTGVLTENKFGTVTYSTAGIYTVTVTVYKTSVCTTSYSQNVTVAAAGCTPSVASVFNDPLVTNDEYLVQGCVDEEKTFTITYGGSGTLSYVEWNMGDGSILYTAANTVSYTYADAGKYFVTAKVVETTGCYDYAKVPLTSTSSNYAFFYCVVVYDPDFEITVSPANPVVGNTINFTYTGDLSLFPPGYTNYWYYRANIDNGGFSSPAALSNGLTLTGSGSSSWTAGSHTYVTDIYGGGTCRGYDTLTFFVSASSCDTCNSFKPKSGETYWLSAWVQEDNGGTQLSTYDDVSISLDFVGTSTTTVTLTPTGEIIDGWQRIAGEFTIPANTYDLEVNLNAGNLTTYFDDIRIHPFNGSMKSYVYDGTTFWLVAELDDNNYATFYEYDAEGGLIRIKKETSGGIVTIQETRSSTVKITP